MHSMGMKVGAIALACIVVEYIGCLKQLSLTAVVWLCHIFIYAKVLLMNDSIRVVEELGRW